MKAKFVQENILQTNLTLEIQIEHMPCAISAL